MSRSATLLRTALAVATLSLPLVARAQTAPTPPPTTPTPTPEPPADPRTRYNGSFHFVGGAGERSGVESAIERAISDMNFITRPIARGRLRDKNPLFTNITVQWTPGTVQVAFAGPSLTYRSPDNGSNVSGQGVGGDHVTFQQHFEGTTLVQVLTGENGSRRNEFVLNADGTALTMRVTISSSQLPQPVRYSLSYHR